MKVNMSGLDRSIRIVVAITVVVLFWQGIIEGTLAYILLALAGIFVATSLISFCPLYAIFGINTCKIKK
ncbi:DUF2892 domain-containing protein [Olleya sp. R77988]|uniref:DUF2892 domain-containing protein n=1 Tax=Olleya sp. R77988 TaxID=3093875 RepID=UPI0037C5AC3A